MASHSQSTPHEHGHGHSHAPNDFGRAFLIGTTLNLTFVVVETVFGFIANSTALLADAGHNLSDVLGLLIAWGGAVMVRRRPSSRFSYGLKKTSILAALINALILLVAVGAIAAEAIRRLRIPETADGFVVMQVAVVGVAVNGVTAWLFARGREKDINKRGA
jgi:cobalt-zinc-cadmium efflux system protein